MSDHPFSTASSVQALKWSDRGLDVLDQRALPGEVLYQTFDTAAGVAEAISSMRVRGAPAIGIAAAYGVVLGAKHGFARGPAVWKQAIEDDIRRLAESRPTAVNLFWALARMREAISRTEGDPVPQLLAVARKIHEDDFAANLAMGELGANLLAGAQGVLTHCNTGALATGGYGTALGVIRSAWRRGGMERVYATETRPWSQGARLTVWELNQDKIPATLLADSAAAWLMKSGAVQWAVVGADRIAANGDVANKIGTYSLAVLAKHHGVKLMVVAPTSTVDWATASGADIVVEERDQRELLHPCFLEAGSVVGAWNPVFDVTPAALVDAIVTEAGVVLNPSAEAMASLR
ncbi:MAG: S-methyl-5-thioribose-1-phosphate isomerase [Methylococcus sp.]|nr:S-methyl-5-thioribose-1-phosphate isomerase [Methylococcus sp.]